jgi:hypothetical protein
VRGVRKGRLGARLAVAVSMTGMLAMNAPALGQTIVPVDKAFRPPLGLTFQGQWQCSDGSSRGVLKVGSPKRAARRAPRHLGQAWTEIVESQEGLTGHYLVGYDHDRRQFVMIDADHPAYAAYQTDGWRAAKLTLTLVNRTDQLSPIGRFVYVVSRSSEFTVAWESQEGMVWTEESLYTCRKISGGSP